MTITKLQKEQIAKELTMPWGRVELICDGYKINLVVERYKELSYRVATYVNGYIKGEWFYSKSESPESRFLRKRVVPNISPTKKKKLEKIYGKRVIAKDPFWSGSVTVFYPDWPSGKAALNHLCKICDSVEIAPSEED
ncbi:hypothetical protein [Undibacterium sp. TJN19]|uniref:hypothetical protein n=1 Tax=Undibacterium sp. TJN19 TaxID=3413055 RepID=UPI003BF106AA